MEEKWFTSKEVVEMQKKNDVIENQWREWSEKYTVEKGLTDLVSKKIHESLKDELDSYFIKGLKRKGFFFNNVLELETFIKERCRCVDNFYLKQRIYYVDDIQFLLHNYSQDPFNTPKPTDDGYKININLGEISFL